MPHVDEPQFWKFAAGDANGSPRPEYRYRVCNAKGNEVWAFSDEGEAHERVRAANASRLNPEYAKPYRVYEINYTALETPAVGPEESTEAWLVVTKHPVPGMQGWEVHLSEPPAAFRENNRVFRAAGIRWIEEEWG